MLTAGLLLALSPVFPQQAEGNASIQKDAAFALALTKQLGFDNFSEIVLEETLQRADTPEDRSSILLARCEVMSTVAQRPIDPLEQVNAWSKAGAAYAEFLGSNPAPSAERRAQLQMGFVGFQYGERLSALFESSPLSEEEKNEYRASAEAIFTEALRSTNQLIGWWTNLDNLDVQQGTEFTVFFPSSFYRALIYYYWGVLYPAGSVEREDNIAQSIGFLEEFAIAAGELSPAGLMAFHHMASGLVALGDFGYGHELYDFVIQEGIPNGDTSQMSQGEIERRQDAQQDAYFGKVQAYRTAGDTGQIPALGATFSAWVAEQSVKLNDSGYRLQLMLAENAINQGAYGEAITIAKAVADANERRVLRLEADQVLGRAISAAPASAVIDLDVLFQAGQGAFFSERFADSARTLRMLVNRLDSSDESAVVGPDAYLYLGRALEGDGLALEAAVAFAAGYNLYPDNEATSESLATRWQRLAERFRNSAPSDEFLDSFYNEALDAVTESSGGGAPHVLLLRAASSEYSKARQLERAARGKGPNSTEGRAVLTAYDKAIAAYKRVTPGTESYEKAFVQIGMCEYNKFAWDNSSAERALAVFNEYLNKIVPDPQQVPTTPKGKKMRADSIAAADFYRGYTYQSMAKAGNIAAWNDMLKAFEGFEDRQPEQTDQIGAVRTSRAEAYLELKQEDLAIAQYEALVAEGARDAWLGACGYQLYSYFSGKIETAQADEARIAAQRQAAKYLGIVNANASQPQWSNLIAEARLHLAVGDVATGTDLLDKTLQRFSEADGLDGSSRLYAQIDLVEGLLEQGNTGSAVSYVDKLLLQAPNMLRVKQLAIKIKCGFPIYREGRVTQIPGEDTLEAFEIAEKLVAELAALAKAEAANDGKTHWSSEAFYAARLQHAYLYYKWSKIDSNKSHLKMIESIERQAPDFGASQGIDPSIPALYRWLATQR
jgi:hypothetical protein